ncbi:MAG: hypothetical protein NZ699_01095 [Roseiflexus sp.]|nr:hypothetical protein [Roseiflexus sp.]MCS7287707.1 hypothetical protein [Roseiflexus sp.]MDW8147906.1 hypothetical protein [Roseiflexaceae bacterium]MDW8231941.1 hypothetical protein [Roseiflexaceae bacterium]
MRDQQMVPFQCTMKLAFVGGTLTDEMAATQLLARYQAAHRRAFLRQARGVRQDRTDLSSFADFDVKWTARSFNNDE